MINLLKNNVKSKVKHSAGRLLSRYADEKSGTASIEFVFIAPLMIFIYIGLYETSIAFTVNGTVNGASEVAASFPTFEGTLDEVKLANIMTASTAVLAYPSFNINNLAIDIYSIEQTGDTPDTRRLVGKASFEGGSASGLLDALTANDFQTNLSTLSAGNGFIVAQVAYRYEPSISSRYVETVTLFDRKILNPRERQGRALNVTTLAGEERASLTCNADANRAFTCSLASQFPEDQSAG